jgi:hypothetical protein
MLNKKALAASVSAPPAVYVEDVFSTWLYIGNGTSQTITNGIDLAGKGGLVWIKMRNDAYSHRFIDTTRGINTILSSNLTAAQSTDTGSLTAFNSNGFSVGAAESTNLNTANLASWTFREQAKFFDVVTYTGTGANRTIAHNLGSVPGMIIVKRTNTTGAWQVYHRANTAAPETDYLVLNTTAATADNINRWNDTLPTSSVFSLGTDATVNANGGTYVAYLFAHDAGGFGTSGTDNVISCGSFTMDGNGEAIVNLGWEVQFVLYKRTDSTGDWQVIDNMRGMSVSSNSARLRPNLANAEDTDSLRGFPTSTGFSIVNEGAGETFVYMAIRRPMKVPTSGTEVFIPITSAGSTGDQLTTNFVIDSQWINQRTGETNNSAFNDRLRGNSSTEDGSGKILVSSSQAAESSLGSTRYWSNTGFQLPSYYSGASTIYWSFRRATGFFDVVCYTGNGSTQNINHNLGAVPELMIVKGRYSGGTSWATYLPSSKRAWLDLTQAASTDLSNYFGNNSVAVPPTSSVFTVGDDTNVNQSSTTYVAYLFDTLAGVSKVGSYTGNGGTQAIACGFTGGARFVLIKRTDDIGDWYVYDTARGMTLLTDPYLELNTTDAEVATLGSVTTTTGGFTVNASILAAINTNAASYIFLAIA